LLILLVQNAEQLIILRLLTGLGAGGVVSAPFPIASELMPAQHAARSVADGDRTVCGPGNLVSSPPASPTHRA
jgi:MFS family permease